MRTMNGVGTKQSINKITAITVIGLFIASFVLISITRYDDVSAESNDIFFSETIYSGSYSSNSDFWQWAVSAGGVNHDWGSDVVVDKSGNVYITGFFRDAVMFGHTNLLSQGDYDIFVAKFNADGVWQWAVRAGGTNWDTAVSAGGVAGDTGYDVAADSSGNLYIIGSFERSARFGNITLVSQGYGDVFVAKLNADGVWQWAVSAGGVAGDTGYDVAAAKDMVMFLLLSLMLMVFGSGL